MYNIIGVWYPNLSLGNPDLQASPAQTESYQPLLTGVDITAVHSVDRFADSSSSKGGKGRGGGGFVVR